MDLRIYFRRFDTENLHTLKERMFLTSASSAEVCGAGMSGLLLLRILDSRSIEPTVAAVARPMVLYRLSADGILPKSEHRSMNTYKYIVDYYSNDSKSKEKTPK